MMTQKIYQHNSIINTAHHIPAKQLPVISEAPITQLLFVVFINSENTKFKFQCVYIYPICRPEKTC